VVGKLISGSGLFLNLLGTILVAYDVFWGPRHDWRKSSLQCQIEMHNNIYEHFRRKLEKGPWNLSDQADKGEFLKNAMNKHKGFVIKLKDELEAEKNIFFYLFYKWSFIGITIIAIGFLLQFIGIFVG
jgi:hypothetical protein